MRHMLFLCAMLFAAAGRAYAAPPPEAIAVEQALAAHKIPAMTVLVIRDGVAGSEVVRGVRQAGGAAPARTGERWLLGSDTKAMTAVLIGRLVEQGKLSWSARLDAMLPELARDMRPEYRDVTLLDLLSHFAGLPDAVSRAEKDPAYVDFVFADRRPMPVQRLDYLRLALSDAPIAPPRTRHSYSNTGYILAAAIAERAAGKPYEQLMREMVFEPLGMSSATFEEAGAAELHGYVGGHAEGPKDANPAIFNGAGEARMTMADWARFCVDQLKGARGKGRLLKPQTYRLLQTAHEPTGEIGPGNPHYGLGWETLPSALGRQGPVLAHSGSDGVWIADVWLFPRTGNGLLIATNSAYSMGADKAIAEAAKAILPTLAPPRTEAAAKPGD